MRSNSAISSDRWLGLDILRAIAVLLVLLRHFENWDFHSRLLNSFMQGAFWIGWAGVDLFFALSGFLISNLLFRELSALGNVSAGRFFVRRAFKIYPGFYFLILLNLAGVVAPQGTISAKSVFGELFFLQNYVGNLWMHTWSLAVEEHFYLLMGTIFFMARPAWIIRFWPWLVLGVVTWCLGARMWNASSHPFDFSTDFFPTHTRIDGLFLGSLSGYLFNFHRRKCEEVFARRKFHILSAMIAFLIISFLFPLEKSRFTQTVGLLALSCGCSLAVMATLLTKREISNPFFGIRGVVNIGRSSYAIYLWHIPVQAWLLPEIQSYFPFHLPDWIRFCAYAGFSLTIGISLTRWVEEPCLRLRERIFPSSVSN